MWRVFWVPRDAVRTGVRRRAGAGGVGGPPGAGGHGGRAGGRSGFPVGRITGSTRCLSLYAQCGSFRRCTAETRRNYATDIRLLLAFLWGRGKSWADAVERDLEDYEHWRRFARENPDRIGGAKWDRELAAFTSLYRWAAGNSHVARNPVAMKQVRARNGDMVTAAAARAKDARRSDVHWLTPRTWRKWIDVGLRGHGHDGCRSRAGSGGWRTATSRSRGCWSPRGCAGPRAGRC